MSAGTGVMHSEQNPTDETTHLYQIWIFPRERFEPGYEEKSLPETSPGQWCWWHHRTARGLVMINADTRVCGRRV